MGFAIPFFRNFKYLDQNIQFNINYKPDIKQLDNFISIYGTHRINLIIQKFDNKDIEIIQILKEKYPDSKIVICIPHYNPTIEQLLNQHKFQHYYNELVTMWDKFNGFLSLNVTDIFVAEDLLFSAKILSSKAKKNGKSLRCFCNVCQSSWDATPSLKTFFIRPEDISLYNQYIDTFEFYIRNNSINNLNTLYEIYTKKQKWLGRLNEIIIGYEGQEDSRFIIPKFGEKRLNCGKKCVQEIDGNLTCRICDRIMELEKTLKDKNVAVVIDKKQNL